MSRKRVCPPGAVTAIFVEGGDEERIVQLLTPAHLVFVQCFDGRTPELVRARTLAAANDPGWPRISRVGVVLDAEESVQDSWSIACDVFKALDLQAPSSPGVVDDCGSSRVGAFLLPDNQALGCSETLLLRAATPALSACIDAFFTCTPNPGTTTAKRDKARAHAMAAATVDGGRPDALWPQQDRDGAALAQLRRFFDHLLA